LLVKEKLSVSFSEEERELFETMFRGFSPVEFMKLMRIGRWREAGAGEELAREGEALAALALIYNGRASVWVGEREVTQLKDGHFVGEMSFATRGPASATVRTTVPTRPLTWSREELNKLLARNPSIRLSLQGVLGENMARKLQEQSPGESDAVS
jgi:CRP-like cAMP-binding protein